MGNTVFAFDTCDCVIEWDEGGKYVMTHAACKLHKPVVGDQRHLDEVLAHHRPFNDLARYEDQAKGTALDLADQRDHGFDGKHPRQRDAEQKCTDAKHAERERIRNLKED